MIPTAIEMGDRVKYYVDHSNGQTRIADGTVVAMGPTPGEFQVTGEGGMNWIMYRRHLIRFAPEMIEQTIERGRAASERIERGDIISFWYKDKFLEGVVTKLISSFNCVVTTRYLVRTRDDIFSVNLLDIVNIRKPWENV